MCPTIAYGSDIQGKRETHPKSFVSSDAPFEINLLSFALKGRKKWHWLKREIPNSLVIELDLCWHCMIFFFLNITSVLTRNRHRHEPFFFCWKAKPWLLFFTVVRFWPQATSFCRDNLSPLVANGVCPGSHFYLHRIYLKFGCKFDPCSQLDLSMVHELWQEI